MINLIEIIWIVIKIRIIWDNYIENKNNKNSMNIVMV
jgi:hypothetical protein